MKMKIMCSFYLWILFCSVLELYKRFAYFILGLSKMDCVKNLRSDSDVECGFLVIGFGPMIKMLVIFKVLHYGFVQFDGLVRFLFDFREKLRVLFGGFCSKSDFGDGFDSKCLSCKCGEINLLEESKNPNLVDSNGNKDDDDNGDDDGGGDGELEELCNEDEVFDVLTLRKIIRTERRRVNAVRVELEKERMASASAAEEAMGMIMRLQNEKSLIEMASEQFRKMTVHKQMYDQEVIDSLQWLVGKHESQISLLEDRLSLCRRKLKTFVKNIDEQCQDFDPTLRFSNSIAEDNTDVLISSLKMDLPQ